MNRQTLRCLNTPSKLPPSPTALPPSPTAPRTRHRGRRTGLLTVVAVAVLALLGPAAGIAVADPDPGGVSGGVLAQEVVLAQAESVDEVLTNIRNWIMGIAAGLATVFVTVGAVRYMAAGGDLGEVEKAKTAFRSAAFGYALALLTPLVLSVLRDIVGAG